MRNSRLALLLLTLSAFAVGCGSSGLPNFEIAAAPTAVTLQKGGSARLLSVAVSPIGGFASPVNVSLSGLPAGVTATPASLSVKPGQLAQFTLTASMSAAETSGATVTVTGSAGSISHTAVAALTVSAAPAPDFTISAAPSTIALQSGGGGRSLTVTAAAVNGFADPVSVSLSGLPAGVTASPSTVSVAPGQLAQFTLTASTSAAPTSASTITITASADSLTHTTTAALAISAAVVPDFTISSTPASISMTSGGSKRSLTVSAAAINGFTDPVSISLSGLPAGVTATPSTLSVTPGQVGQFILTAASSAASVSGATVTLTGSADSLTHTTTAALTISPAVVPDFTISSQPASVTITSGGSTQSLSVSAAPVNGFTDPVSVSLSGLPAGVTATPSTLSVTPGQVGQFTLTAASSAASVSGAIVTLTGSADSLTHSATTALTIVAPVSNASINATSFDFGGNLVGSTLTKSVVTVTNTGAANITLAPVLSGDSGYSIAAGGCGSVLAPGASCSEGVSYAPTTASGSSPQTATLNLGLGNVPAGTAQTVALTGLSAALVPGTVSGTNNPQVAQYSVTLPYPGSVTVSFGKDTTYGRQTWTRTTTNPGETVTMLVAGMLPNTLYHMQAAIQLSNGVAVTDADHTFTTGTPELQPNILVTSTTGLTPQSGLEQLTLLGSAATGIVDTDLQGNILWTYALPNNPSQPGADDIEGVKLMENGHFLITIGQGSSFALTGSTTPSGSVAAVREIDLAGNIVREITAADLTDELQATGHNITISQFHHDVVPMPNGHWIVLASTVKSFASVTGETGPQNVLGDVVVDLDENLQPVWVWNEFDHLDVNRHPMGFPDWTHTNAILYSPTDHNLIISMRHQNWVVKVDYQDGAGTGNILWRLGQGGDFKLVGGTDPTDWNYAQHYPSLFTPNSSGVFSLGMMDNGDDRILPDGGTCGTGSEPACYSTIPVFQLDETAMTATITFHQIVPTALYNPWGGNAEQLGNGNVEYDLSGLTTAGSDVFEVTPDPTNPQTVWEMQLTGSQAYRAYRVPSLYPGVQW